MVGALINLVGHYFIGLPIGVCLMFAAKMGIIGKKRLERVLTPAGVAQGQARALKPSFGVALRAVGGTDHLRGNAGLLLPHIPLQTGLDQGF